MTEPKYRLPTWLQALWVIVCFPVLILEYVLRRDDWGPIAITALAVLCFVTGLYNKSKTGMWLPGARKNTPKNDA